MNKILIAYKRGYRCTSDGVLLNPKNKKIGIINSIGYISFSMRIAKKITNVSAHRIQAFQKYGHKLFEQGIEVRHLNGNKEDFSWNNIAIGNHSQNMMDVPSHIRLSKAIHATSFIRKYDKDEVKAFHEKSVSYKKTMAHFGMSSKGTLHFILNK